jgi:hypothetical protein
MARFSDSDKAFLEDRITRIHEERNHEALRSIFTPEDMRRAIALREAVEVDEWPHLFRPTVGLNVLSWNLHGPGGDHPKGNHPRCAGDCGGSCRRHLAEELKNILDAGTMTWRELEARARERMRAALAARAPAMEATIAEITAAEADAPTDFGEDGEPLAGGFTQPGILKGAEETSNAPEHAASTRPVLVKIGDILAVARRVRKPPPSKGTLRGWCKSAIVDRVGNADRYGMAQAIKALREHGLRVTEEDFDPKE